MKKLYVITVQMHSTMIEMELKRYMAAYKQQYILGSTCWLIVTEKNADTLRNEITQKVSREDIIFVAEIAPNPLCSMNSNALARWLPRQLTTVQ